ncbi:hypothetical protein METP1_01950 [Methanosarcinales archaeon]|nr:hypothetical protein METP1_01950 [Methanosarcinales archaeon]
MVVTIYIIYDQKELSERALVKLGWFIKRNFGECSVGESVGLEFCYDSNTYGLIRFICE